MTIEIKYRHPLDQSLEWSGKGRSPKWYDYALENGFVEADLLVEYQKHVATKGDEIDLDIGGAEVVEAANVDVLVPGNSNTRLDIVFGGREVSDGITVSGTKLDVITAAERALAEFLEVDLAASTEVLLFRVRENSRVLLIEEIRMGLRLIALKESLAHGDFLPALAEIGITDRAAQGAMRTARVFAAEGNARRRQQLLDMGKTNGAALLAAKPEVRQQILDDPELAREALESSKLGLQALLKEKEAQIERHQKAYADLETQLDIRKLELQKLQKVDPVTLLTRSVRAEAVANAAAIGDLCDNLIRLGEAVDDESIAADQRRLRQRAVGAAVGSAIGHLQALYMALEGDLGDGIPMPTALDDLTQDEISRAIACRSFVQVQFGRRIEQRRDEAYGEHLADGGAKKRGRPAKTQGGR